jgi:hypothetical protein
LLDLGVFVGTAVEAASIHWTTAADVAAAAGDE